MPINTFRSAALLAGLLFASALPALAQDIKALADTLPSRVLFVVSGGFWAETLPDPEEMAPSDAPATEKTEGDANQSSASPDQRTPQRGYYRLIAIRGEDNRSLVFLQRLALGPEGPDLVLSIAVEEINGLGAYVTDIRPENSTGAASQAGFAAFIYLKTDTAVVEPETWAVFVDEFGDVVVEKSTN